MTDSASVFISYSTKDSHFVERLRANLKTANIPYWIDKEGLQAGTQNWEKAIRAAIRESSSVILVASPNAYESNYVQDEIAIAQMHNRMIYPVWADGEHWIACVPMGMGKTQHIDMRGDRFESNFRQLVKTLGGADPSLAYTSLPAKPPAPGLTRRNPYKGLEAFQEKDVGDFFGRTAAINELLNRFKDRVSADKGRLLAVIGASGSGKSSVVMAGLLPHLKTGAISGSEAWLYIPPITPGNAPIRALTRGLSKVLPDKSFSAIEDELRRRNGLGLSNLAYAIDRRVVLYIDQFEELFMPGVSADERDRYISLIVQAVNEPEGNLTVLLSLRADFYDRPTNYRELGALISHYNYTLLPMSLSELREAVESPTQLPDVGLAFEPGLVGDLVFELRESKDRMALAGALPLLQFTLQQLYEKRDQSGDVHKLTQAAYQEIGGVSGAISQHAEVAFAALDEEAQSRMGRVFFRLINVDERGETTRERANLAVFESDVAAMRLIDALINARLLLSNRNDVSATVEVAHEALLRNWHRLVKWIENASEGKRLLQKLEIDAEFWLKRGKPRDHFRYMHEQEKEIALISEQWMIEHSVLVNEFLQPEIERLIRSLDGDEWQVNMQVAQNRLLAIGTDTIPFLITALEDVSKNVRSRVALLLGELRDPRAVEPLIGRLSDRERNVRIKAVDALGQLSDVRAIKPLVDILADPEKQVRERVVNALVEFGGRAVDILISALENNDRVVRGGIIDVLGQLGDLRALETLIAALKDSEPAIRGKAASALGQLGDERAIEPLITALSDPDNIVRTHVALALGRFPDGRVADALVTALNDIDTDVRLIIAGVLGQLGYLRAVNGLIRALGDIDKRVREQAAKSLGMLGSIVALDPLADVLRDDQRSVRKAAQKAIDDITYKNALDGDPLYPP